MTNDVTDDIEKHVEAYQRILKEYSLAEKADEIAEFLTSNVTNSEEFSKLFNVAKDDAEIFLSFIKKGLSFRDKMNKI